jgi:threonine dehydrogenase-like Zn-dependent dehydrogenase
MYGPGDVRVENVPDPTLQQPTDALVRVVRACVCGSDLHPYHSRPASAEGSPMGHEFIGVVEETGSAVSTVKAGDFVIAPFAWFDNTCEFCREGLTTSCVHGGFFSTAQAEVVRVPLADGTLVKAPRGGGLGAPALAADAVRRPDHRSPRRRDSGRRRPDVGHGDR